TTRSASSGEPGPCNPYAAHPRGGQWSNSAELGRRCSIPGATEARTRKQGTGAPADRGRDQHVVTHSGVRARVSTERVGEVRRVVGGEGGDRAPATVRPVDLGVEVIGAFCRASVDAGQRMGPEVRAQVDAVERVDEIGAAGGAELLGGRSL